MRLRPLFMTMTPTMTKDREHSRTARPTRVLLAFVILAVAFSFYAGQITTTYRLGASCSSFMSPPAAGGVWNESRLLEMTGGNRHMVYFHKADILFVTMAKAGSSSLWHWLYRGTTGQKRWDGDACTFHVHEKRSNCWVGHASYLHSLPTDVQQRILTNHLNIDASRHSASSNDSSGGGDAGTLRVAIQRDPYERIVSAFKSKFTCEAQRFSTDVHERHRMVSQLRKAANLPPPPASSASTYKPLEDDCMNVTEFATALDIVRLHKGQPRYPSSLADLDDHIRPQDFFFDEIDYHMVIDVSHLSDLNVMRPIIDRLPFKPLVQDGISQRHSSGDNRLAIPDDAAAKLYSYSLESKPGTLKFLPNAYPSSNP